MVEDIVKCPACIEGKLQVLSDQIEIPHFGEIVISTFICSNCGYRSSDIIPLKSSKPMRHILRIDTPNKMNLRVVRSGSSTVMIPEIGGRMDPGLYSDGYITNVEGVLRRFQDILLQLQRDIETSPDDQDVSIRKNKVREFIDLLEAFINKKINEVNPITLIIEDPLGNSAIISEEGNGILKEPLTDEEVTEMISSKQKKELITDL